MQKKSTQTSIGSALTTFAFAMSLSLVCSCANRGGQEPPSLVDAYERLVVALGDPRLPEAKRHVASALLIAGDEDVLPVLVSHLSDNRVFLAEYVGSNETADADRVVPKRKLSVGEECKSILLEILFGTVRVPQTAIPADWDRWIVENRGKPVSVLRDEARAQLRKHSP